MSRAINLSAAPDVVTTLCDKNDIGISSIEPLESGGTRVVLRTSDGAETIRRKMKSQIVDGPVVRSGLYMARKPLPLSQR